MIEDWTGVHKDDNGDTTCLDVEDANTPAEQTEEKGSRDEGKGISLQNPAASPIYGTQDPSLTRYVQEEKKEKEEDKKSKSHNISNQKFNVKTLIK